MPMNCGSIFYWEVHLFFCGPQLVKQIKDLINNPMRPCPFSVYLINHKNGIKTVFE